MEYKREGERKDEENKRNRSKTETFKYLLYRYRDIWNSYLFATVLHIALGQYVPCTWTHEQYIMKYVIHHLELYATVANKRVNCEKTVLYSTLKCFDWNFLSTGRPEKYLHIHQQQKQWTDDNNMTTKN